MNGHGAFFCTTLNIADGPFFPVYDVVCTISVKGKFRFLFAISFLWSIENWNSPTDSICILFYGYSNWIYRNYFNKFPFGTLDTSSISLSTSFTSSTSGSPIASHFTAVEWIVHCILFGLRLSGACLENLKNICV